VTRGLCALAAHSLEFAVAAAGAGGGRAAGAPAPAPRSEYAIEALTSQPATPPHSAAHWPRLGAASSLSERTSSPDEWSYCRLNAHASVFVPPPPPPPLIPPAPAPPPRPPPPTTLPVHDPGGRPDTFVSALAGWSNGRPAMRPPRLRYDLLRAGGHGLRRARRAGGCVLLPQRRGSGQHDCQQDRSTHFRGDCCRLGLSSAACGAKRLGGCGRGCTAGATCAAWSSAADADDASAPSAIAAISAAAASAAGRRRRRRRRRLL